MRKIVLGLLLAVGSLSVSAQHIYHPGHNHGSYTYRGQASTYHHGHHHVHRHGHYGWVVPALIGGAVVYAATRPQVIVQEAPVVVQQPTPAVVYIDGVPYIKQIMIINGVQQEVLMRQ